MSKINQILADIKENDLEVPIYNILHDTILKSYEKEIKENNEKRASLTAIKKINQNKNQAIDALCEGE